MSRMLTIQELSAAANITDTATSNISDLEGKSWQTEVVHFGEALRRFDQAVDMNENMVGIGDKTISIPKTASVKSITTSNTQGDVRTVTELDNLEMVDLTISASSWKRGVISITKQILSTSRIDLIKEARGAVASALAQDADLAIAGSGTGDSVTENGVQHSDVTNHVYGGDATTPETLAAGDIFTTDLVPDAMAQIEASNFIPKFLYISSYQLKALRKDPQFVNASEFGSDRVVLRGEIGEYLGLSVISTTNTPAYAISGQDINEYASGADTDVYAVASNVCPVIGIDKKGKKVAGTLAWKEKPAVGYEYERDESLHKIYYDQCFVFGLVQPKAVSLIKVTQA